MTYFTHSLTHSLAPPHSSTRCNNQLAAISPADTNFEDTLSTLRYASSTKRIVTTATVNVAPKDQLIKSLREEMEALKEQLKAQAAQHARLLVQEQQGPSEQQQQQQQQQGQGQGQGGHGGGAGAGLALGSGAQGGGGRGEGEGARAHLSLGARRGAMAVLAMANAVGGANGSGSGSGGSGGGGGGGGGMGRYASVGSGLGRYQQQQQQQQRGGGGGGGTPPRRRLQRAMSVVSLRGGSHRRCDSEPLALGSSPALQLGSPAFMRQLLAPSPRGGRSVAGNAVGGGGGGEEEEEEEEQEQGAAAAGEHGWRRRGVLPLREEAEEEEEEEEDEEAATPLLDLDCLVDGSFGAQEQQQGGKGKRGSSSTAEAAAAATEAKAASAAAASVAASAAAAALAPAAAPTAAAAASPRSRALARHRRQSSFARQEVVAEALEGGLGSISGLGGLGGGAGLLLLPRPHRRSPTLGSPAAVLAASAADGGDGGGGLGGDGADGADGAAGGGVGVGGVGGVGNGHRLLGSSVRDCRETASRIDHLESLLEAETASHAELVAAGRAAQRRRRLAFTARFGSAGDPATAPHLSNVSDDAQVRAVLTYNQRCFLVGLLLITRRLTPLLVVSPPLASSAWRWRCPATDDCAQLSGGLLIFLPPGRTTVGRADAAAEQTVKLAGLGVQAEHAVLLNRQQPDDTKAAAAAAAAAATAEGGGSSSGNGSSGNGDGDGGGGGGGGGGGCLSISHSPHVSAARAPLFVNGRRLGAADGGPHGCPLRHGDRVVIGFCAHLFCVVVPEEARAAQEEAAREQRRRAEAAAAAAVAGGGGGSGGGGIAGAAGSAGSAGIAGAGSAGIAGAGSAGPGGAGGGGWQLATHAQVMREQARD